MSYLTLDAEINHGQIVVKEPEKLPESGHALITVLQPNHAGSQDLTPLQALESLQQHLKLDENKANEWMTTVRDARR